MATRAVLSIWQGLVLLLPTNLATPLYAVVLADANPLHCCTGFFGGCARRCSPRRIACTCFFGGCARRCSPPRITCTCFFDSCARRCSIRRIAATFSKPQSLDGKDVPNERMRHFRSSLSRASIKTYSPCLNNTAILENRTMLKEKRSKTKFEPNHTAGSSCRIKGHANRAATRTLAFSQPFYKKIFY
jgi:hypothetical protein